MIEIQPDKIIEKITNKKTGKNTRMTLSGKQKVYHQKTLEEM